MKITKDYFANYKYLETGIKAIQRRLDYFEKNPLGGTHGIVKGSMSSFPYNECHFVVSGTNLKSSKERERIVNKLTLDLEGNLRLMEDMKLDIETFIESSELLKPEEKLIFRLKFIDGMNDKDIAEEMLYERSTISKKIDGVIKRLPDNYGDQEISSRLTKVSHTSHS